MINNLIKWSTLEDLLRLKGNHWQLRTFISHPVDSGYNVSVFTTQGNRLGFYEKLGKYEARPSYRWERLHHDEEIKMKLKMDIIVLKRRDLGPIQIHLSTFDHFQTTERRLLPVLQFSKASLGGHHLHHHPPPHLQHYHNYHHYHHHQQVDTQFFFGASLFSRLENRVQSYCLEDYAEWAFYNNSQMEFTEDLKVTCSRVESVCCHKLRVSSSNSENSSYYGEENSKVLGD